MLRGGGIFTVKIPTFSGKTAENVMGVYGIDCPAIFWDRECTTFWGGGRGCAGALTRPSTRHLPPKNFEKTALRKRGGIFTVKMRGGHNYGNYCTCSFENPCTQNIALLGVFGNSVVIHTILKALEYNIGSNKVVLCSLFLCPSQKSVT